MIFADGQSSASFTVAITDDTFADPAERFFVTLSAPVNATLGSPATIAVRIVDDENVLAIPTLSPLTLLLLTAMLAAAAALAIERA